MARIIEPRFRTFWPRFWAGCIDAGVWFPLLYVDLWFDEQVRSPVSLASWLIAYTFSFDVYSVAMHTRFGQTLGKMAMGVKVLDVSENSLSFRQALLRDCVPIAIGLLFLFDDLPRVLAGVDRTSQEELDWVTQVAVFGSLFWFVAELLTMLLSSKRRALHDLIAGSVVVRTRSTTVHVKSDASAG